MEEKRLKNLRMVKVSLADVPEAALQDGFELRTLRNGEEKTWEKLCEAAFEGEQNYVSVVKEKKGYVEDGVFIILHGEKLIATGTAICDHDNEDNLGYVHMIAADKAYSGKKLGYEITAAVLRRLREDGFTGAELHTDDFRKPAIMSYYRLGFRPDLERDGTMPERWKKIYEELGIKG